MNYKVSEAKRRLEGQIVELMVLSWEWKDTLAKKNDLSEEELKQIYKQIIFAVRYILNMIQQFALDFDMVDPKMLDIK